MTESTHRQSPLSLHRVMAFLGINLTLGSLLSAVANIAQILTVTNGIVIFSSVFAVSAIYLIRQVWLFQQGQRKEITNLQNQNQVLKMRLERISVALKTRMDGNPRPDAVIAWVSVKKFFAASSSIQIKEISDDILILDKGGRDGLVSRLSCKIAKKGTTTHIEESEIDWVDPDSHQSIMRHSGANIQNGDNPAEYSVELIVPSITLTERIIGNILLISEGFEPDWV